MTAHKHTPELRLRNEYNPAVIKADAWVCAECEQFLGYENRRSGGVLGVREGDDRRDDE